MDRHDSGDGDGPHAFIRRYKIRVILRRYDCRQIIGLKTGQIFDIQEMHPILMGNPVEGAGRLAADIDERIEFAALEPLDGVLMVEIKRIDCDAVGLENGFGGTRHTAVLRAEAHAAPCQILQT